MHYFRAIPYFQSRCSRIALAFFIFLPAAGGLLGQVNTAALSGSVTDSTHAAIIGAHLELLDELRGVTTAASTNSSGQFVFQFVPVGRYTLTVRQTGFQEQVRKGLELAAGQTLTLDFTLDVSTAQQQVTVTAQQERLDASTSDQHSTLSKQTVQELPQSKLDWTNLLQLNNGVTKNSGALSINGLPSAGFNLTVDGTNASSDAALPQLGFYLGFNVINTINSDAIQEISTTKGIAPASVAGSMSGNVNIISKGGTNQFHGNLMETNSVAAFNARNQFLKTRPGSTFNQYGGSLGGPIIHDKLFFFVNYQGVKGKAFTAISGNVPTPEFKDQTLASAPFYRTILDKFPVPNQPYAPGSVTGMFVSAGSTSQNDSNGVIRLDYYLTQTDFLTLRFIRSRPDQLQPRIITENKRVFTGHDAFYNLQFTHSRGTWYAVTRIGYNNSRFDRSDLGYDVGLDSFSYGGFSTGGAEVNLQKGASQTWEETIALVRGRHSLQFGGIVQRQDAKRSDYNTNSFSYSTLGDFLANIPSTVLIQPPLLFYDAYMYQFGGFAQDNFRVRPNLTLNLGLRYDYFKVPREEHGRMYNRGQGTLGPGFGDFRPADSPYEAYYPNISPRVGFAWSLGTNRKTVVRSGFGMFFNPHPMYQGVVELTITGPNVPLKLTLNRAQALAQGLKYPVDTNAYLTQLERSGAPIANTTINGYFPNPYSMQWTFGVQRELPFGLVLDTAYVGNRGIHLGIVRMENLPDRVTGIAPNPAFGQFRFYDSSDASRYNAWQTSLEKRFSSGLAFAIHHTWASNLALGYADLLLQPVPQDNNNLRADYGPTPFDTRQVFAANYLYELPLAQLVGGGKGPARLLLGGWQLSGILTAASGSPANVTIGNSSYPNSRPDAVLGNTVVNDNYRNTLQYLNAATFATVPLISASGASARPGNLGKNAVRAPGVWSTDFAIAKNFAFLDRCRLQLRGDLFNAFNHTNLSGLQTNLSSSSFGRLTSASARTMQVGARLTF